MLPSIFGLCSPNDSLHLRFFSGGGGGPDPISLSGSAWALQQECVVNKITTLAPSLTSMRVSMGGGGGGGGGLVYTAYYH